MMVDKSELPRFWKIFEPWFLVSVTVSLRTCRSVSATARTRESCRSTLSRRSTHQLVEW